MVKTSKSSWIIVVRVASLVLFLILEKLFSFFSTFRIMFAVCLLYMSFNMLRWVPTMPIFWILFDYKWVLDFVKKFLWNYWDDNIFCVFIFPFVNIVHHPDLCILENHFILDVKAIWSWCLILYYIVGFCWLEFVENFSFDFHHSYWPVIFSFIVSLSGFDNRTMVAL